MFRTTVRSHDGYTVAVELPAESVTDIQRHINDLRDAGLQPCKPDGTVISQTMLRQQAKQNGFPGVKPAEQSQEVIPQRKPRSTFVATAIATYESRAGKPYWQYRSEDGKTTANEFGDYPKALVEAEIINAQDGQGDNWQRPTSLAKPLTVPLRVTTEKDGRYHNVIKVERIKKPMKVLVENLQVGDIYEQRTDPFDALPFYEVVEVTHTEPTQTGEIMIHYYYPERPGRDSDKCVKRKHNAVVVIAGPSTNPIAKREAALAGD